MALCFGGWRFLSLAMGHDDLLLQEQIRLWEVWNCMVSVVLSSTVFILFRPFVHLKFCMILVTTSPPPNQVPDGKLKFHQWHAMQWPFKLCKNFGSIFWTTLSRNHCVCVWNKGHKLSTCMDSDLKRPKGQSILNIWRTTFELWVCFISGTYNRHKGDRHTPGTKWRGLNGTNGLILAKWKRQYFLRNEPQRFKFCCVFVFGTVKLYEMGATSWQGEILPPRVNKKITFHKQLRVFDAEQTDFYFACFQLSLIHWFTCRQRRQCSFSTKFRPWHQKPPTNQSISIRILPQPERDLFAHI